MQARRAALAISMTLVGAAAAAQQPPAPPPLSPIQVIGAQAGFGTAVVAGPGARLELPPGLPPEAVRLLDGQPVPAETWAGGWQPGSHVASVQVPGPAGEPTQVTPLSFVYDPGAPTLEYVTGTPELLEGYGLDQDVQRKRPPRHTRPERDKRVALLWSPDGRRWLPVLPRGARPDESGALADWLVAADRPQVFLWALEPGVFGSGAPVAPGKLGLVRVWAEDELSAVRDLRLRVFPNDDGSHRLEMVASDIVGNTVLAAWPLSR